jgi:hypothetical protein
MSGLYLLAIGAAWLVIVLALARALTLRIKTASLRSIVTLLVVGVLLPLPLIDEFLGKRQFEQLCKDNAAIQVDRKTAVGKTVYYVPQPSVEVSGTWVRIVMKPQRFVDATTGEVVVSYNELEAVGGRLVQTFGISEGRVPLTFTGSCGPVEKTRDLFRSLEIVAKDLPERNHKE